MLNKRYLPHRGLEKHNQGMTQPVHPKIKLDRSGFGTFSVLAAGIPATPPPMQIKFNDYPVILCGLVSGHYPQKKIQAATSLMQEQLEAIQFSLEYPNFCY